MIRAISRLASATCCVAMVCCGGDDAGSTLRDPDASMQRSRPGPPTYHEHMAPLFAQHCLRCHSEGGIAPFRLDDYAQAKSFASLIAHVTRERTMPPWGVTSDGSCGEFANSEALRDDEIELITEWAESGALQGKPRKLEVPAPLTLGDAREFKTPSFAPVIQGGELAAFDEYRCFALDAPADPTTFITGYEVVPGRPEIVHHVLLLLVDPDAPCRLKDSPGCTNGEVMRALDAQSPEREGWPCFGMAGDGVAVKAVPIAWAPGQGVVNYPNDSGVPLPSHYKMVIQVHYNLADERNLGKVDETTIRLRLVPKVQNQAVFVLVDRLLDTLYSDSPTTLPPGQRSAVYAWKAIGKELSIGMLPEVQLYGIMPHMHELGRKYEMTLTTPGASAQCAAKVERWDFDWQRMYFYASPLTVNPETELSVSCDYDTSSKTEPVKPGWGTRNEMCLATMMFSVPMR